MGSFFCHRRAVKSQKESLFQFIIGRGKKRLRLARLGKCRPHKPKRPALQPQGDKNGLVPKECTPKHDKNWDKLIIKDQDKINIRSVDPHPCELKTFHVSISAGFKNK